MFLQNPVVVLVCFCPLASSLTISPQVLPSPVLEGTEVVITCTTSGAGAGAVVLLVNGQFTGVVGVIQSTTSVRVFSVTVDRSHNRANFTCINTFDNAISGDAILPEVLWPPSFTLSVSSGSVFQHVEGGNQVVTVQGLDLGNPPAAGVEWSVNRVGLTNGGSVTVSDSGISLSDMRRSQSGEYSARVNNMFGSVATGFILQVIAITSTQGTVTHIQPSNLFTFSCAPLAMPGEFVFRKDDTIIIWTYTLDHYTINGPLLSIMPVVRSDSGRYSCTANNTAGIISVVSFTLNVVVDPGRPEDVIFPSIGPYSVTVRWNQPSDNGGTPDPLMYKAALVTALDGRSVNQMQTSNTQVTFSALIHNNRYTVSVSAVNSFGQQGGQAVRTFMTSGISPVIGSVAAIALSLSEVQVTVTLSDIGGQPVDYTVTINGTVMMFRGSAGLQFIGNVTGLTLITGLTYSVSVVARNSAGSSETFEGTFYVPFPPNITMQPVAVTPDKTTTQCCAGIRVFLEDPTDPTIVFTAQVNTDGTPFTDSSVTREGDVVYVEGLQAGTPYNIRLTGRNMFGHILMNILTIPLIGSPSNPSLPVVSVVGSSVSIQLSTRYPGTNTRGQFKFSLIFSSVSTAKRQSLQPTEVQVDPTGLDTSVTTTHTLTNVGAGSYTVSVMAVNENRASQTVTAKFIVRASSTDLLPAVIALGAALSLVTVLLAVAAIIILLQYIRNRMVSTQKDRNTKGPDSHYDEVEMEPKGDFLPELGPSNPPTEPQHEMYAVGVTSTDVAMEENPAYQSMDVAAAKP